MAVVAEYAPRVVERADVRQDGIGRLGGIVGPYAGGILLARHWSTEQLFVAAALPALLSVVTMLALRTSIAPRAPEPAALPSH